VIRNQVTRFQPPKTFTFKDKSEIKVNGLNIYPDINKAIGFFNKADFSNFGKTIGTVVINVINVKALMEEQTPLAKAIAAFELLRGFGMGPGPVIIGDDLNQLYNHTEKASTLDAVLVLVPYIEQLIKSEVAANMSLSQIIQNISSLIDEAVD